MSVVLYGVRDGVATITLNRPEQRNALDLAMCDALTAAARAAADDPAVRVVFVRGSGSAFCSGADLNERAHMDDAAVRARRMRAFEAYAAIEALPMPVVAIVHGAAVGSGCEIAAACDFVVATAAATFRTPEAQRGTIGATQRLPRVLGLRLAKDLMFTGRTMTAEDAHAAGLVTRIVSAEKLEQALADITTYIRGASPRVLAAAKRCMTTAVEQGPAAALAAEVAAIDDMLADPEARAGLTILGEGSNRPTTP